jgi:class 3 adenylate cyclase/tetratricopeptide (TPR) repeat protein
MNEGDTVRKLRAIMFSDIVGYSKMMQANETEALKLLQKHKEVVTEISAKYGGNIIKHIGDEILVESESAVMLVSCAKELQKYFEERNSTVPKARELWVRIGIHIGDVIIKENDIFGDGVNIASRIRPIARPGGIVITHSVLILLGNQGDIKCSFLGNKKLKNIKEKVQVYEVLLDSQTDQLHNNGRPFELNRDNILKIYLPIGLTFFFLFLMFFLMAFNNFTDYEEDYYRSDYKSSYEITQQIKSSKNVKANYFNIVSSPEDESDKIIRYYRQMNSSEPDNPKTALFLAAAYLHSGRSGNMLDSAAILIRKAERSGLNSVYLKILKLDIYTQIRSRMNAEYLAQNLSSEYSGNPLVLFKCAGVYRDLCKDTDKASLLYRKALNEFSDYAAAMNALSEMEYDRYEPGKAKAISDSSLAVNPSCPGSVSQAVKVYTALSEFDKARKVLEQLPDEDVNKYLLNAKINLIENDPAAALECINEGQAEFPTESRLIDAYYNIQKIITLSDSIQQKESSVSSSKNKWISSWEDAVKTSSKEKKPLLIAALDNENISSKYLEFALTQDEIAEAAGDAVLYRLYRHSDKKLLDEFGITGFPALILTDENKYVIRSFTNTKGNISDREVVYSFIKESVELGKRKLSMEKDTEENRYKTARDFSHAEELALEFEIPVIVVLSPKGSAFSETYLKQTIFNPGFMENYRKTVLLSASEDEIPVLAKKYNISKFPAVLFFDEDMNLISSKYGVMPQKVLSAEIDKIRLFRKRKDMPKEEINWVYDQKEAARFSALEGKNLFVYFSGSDEEVYSPQEIIFSDYEIIKKINSSYIPLYIVGKNSDLYKKGETGSLPAVGFMNRYGDLIYCSALPEDKFSLNSFLDFKTNSDILLSIGSRSFKRFLMKADENFMMLKNRLYESAGTGLITSIIANPGYTYNITGYASLLLARNNILSAEHYIGMIEDKTFIISDKFLETLVSSFMLYDDFNRLSDVLNSLSNKFSKDPLALASIFAAAAEANLAQSNTLEAIDFAKKALDLDPKRTDNLILLGLLNFTIDKPASESYFKSALVVDPDNLTANSYLYKLTGVTDYATVAKRAFYSGKDDFFGLRYFNKSRTFNHPGISELRDRAYRIKLSLFPNETQFMLELCRFITDSRGDMNEAYDISNLLLEKEPDNPDYLSTASWVYYNLGDYPGADRLITKALGNLTPEQYSDYPDLFYNIGMIKSAIGDNRSAKFYFEKLTGFNDKEDFDYAKLDYAKRFIESIH